MTRKEWENININKLTEKAQRFIEVSDQGVYEFFKDTNKDDYETISEIAESLADEIEG